MKNTHKKQGVERLYYGFSRIVKGIPQRRQGVKKLNIKNQRSKLHIKMQKVLFIRPSRQEDKSEFRRQWRRI
jgi:hypothetical protein